MKPLLILGIFIMIMVFAQFAHAQTVDDIIEKNMAAMGGKEKLATLNSIRMEGSLNSNGYDVSVVITKINAVGSRTDFSVAGTENYSFVNTTKGEVFMPVFGQTAPQPMPDDQFKAVQPFLDIQGLLANYKDKGIKAELAGKESIEGVECYKLVTTFKNGNVTTFFIDTKTDRVLKTSTGEKGDNFVIYSNYKQNADGYWFAYTTTTTRGSTDFTKIETNIKVDENLFK